MQVKCPNCSALNRVQPGRLIGNYLICEQCHYVFSWEEAEKKAFFKINVKQFSAIRRIKIGRKKRNSSR